MKSVLVDLERLKYRNTGLGEFSFQLAKNLKSESLSLTFLVPEFWSEKFPQATIEKADLWRKFLPQFHQSYGLWHSAHQDSPYWPAKKTDRYLLTIHDLNFLREKSEHKIRQRLCRLQKKVDRATRLTVISEFTRREVESHLRLTDKRIDVVYNGAEIDMAEGAQVPTALNHIADKKFLFSLGVIRPKKNFHVLIEFLSLLPEDTHLVIAGNQEHEYFYEIKSLTKKFKVDHRTHFPGEVQGSEKSWLFRHCHAFVFPSLFEGFGIPVIEAMSTGKPVFISDQSSLPEVGGSEAYYWKSFLAAEMKVVFAQGMHEYLQDSRKVERLKQHAAKFSWQKSALEYERIYREILTERS